MTASIRHRWGPIEDPQSQAEKRGFVHVCLRCGLRRERLITHRVRYDGPDGVTYWAPPCNLDRGDRVAKAARRVMDEHREILAKLAGDGAV